MNWRGVVNLGASNANLATALVCQATQPCGCLLVDSLHTKQQTLPAEAYTPCKRVLHLGVGAPVHARGDGLAVHDARGNPGLCVEGLQRWFPFLCVMGREGPHHMRQ